MVFITALVGVWQFSAYFVYYHIIIINEEKNKNLSFKEKHRDREI